MPKKNNSTVALPARMDLAIDSLPDVKIAVLMFPFAKEVKDFCQDIEKVLRNKTKVYPPYRQLNNGILACSSTLTYGFEYLETIDYTPQYRALAVGKAAELNIPTTAQIYELIYIWAKTWVEQYLDNKGNKDEIKSVCDRFIEAIDKIPVNWQWEFIALDTLIKDLNTQNGLGYQAIPSILVTLLHEQTCTISSEHTEQTLKWRKVQGGGSTRTGLHLVSQPFKATSYIEEDYRKSSEKNAQEREGYFAYRLDFNLHTQAGRFHPEGYLKPWVFIHLSCQRYAHEPLLDANHGRDISILMGMNQARLDNYPNDSTLVRLTLKNNDKKCWQEQLPDLLAKFKVRSLVDPQEILSKPIEYGNLDNDNAWNKDEYYIVHSEGYKYEYKQEDEKVRKHGHSIKTGFSLKERADITNQVLQLLNGVLIPDRLMEFDLPVPAGKKMPLAMRDYEFLRASLLPSALKLKNLTEEAKQQYITEKQLVIADAIKRATNNKPIYLFIIYREEHTKILVRQQLRQALLLQDGDDFPESINVIDVLINEPKFLEKLLVSGLPSDNNNFDEEISKQHRLKRQAWQKFLKEQVIALVDPKTNYDTFAIIEIGRTKQQGIHPQQSIRGAVREACVLENINSQMLQTVKPKDKENPEDDTTYSKMTQGRVLNAILDLILRQTGTLYGLPSEVYQVSGIPKDIAQKLDVIAFCRIEKNNFIGKSSFQYAIAIRLNPTGTVDVLLPNTQRWIPYYQSGIAIGKLFHEARKKDKNSIAPLQMKGGHLVKFVADVLKNHINNPTLALIEADVWRNERSKDGNNNQAWFQLKNEYLLEQRDILNFSHVYDRNCPYQRDDKIFENLLGVIRLRSNNETPQYVTNRTTWDEDSTTSDFTELSGFIDKTVPELVHYFSVGKIPTTQKQQNTPGARESYKSARAENVDAANIAYKHQKMLEMLPFFVRPDFQTEENLKALCRVPHFLRTSPAFTRGNISHPFPMHLGMTLIQDFLCILDLDL
ncbi:MAG: pPIWI_RE module domain-containing protein [Microcoleus sp.]